MVTIASILMVSVIISTKADPPYPMITSDDINNLRIDIRSAIDQSTFESRDILIENGDQPLIASIVRLVFHDCVGRNIKQNNGNGADSPSGQLTDNKCNGCFDFDEPDNAGLEERAFNQLEDIYTGVTNDNEWDSKMSRADFWVAAGTI